MSDRTKELTSTAPSAPGIMATYRPDAVVVGNPGVPVVGSASLPEMCEGFVSAGFPFTIGVHDVIITDATALHLMDWRGAGPDDVPFRALSAAALTRDESGNWRMVIDRPFADGAMHSP